MRPKTVQLRCQPGPDGTVEISLHNRTSRPARYYNSLSAARPGDVPDLTIIRLRDGRGQVLTPRLTGPEGYWSRNLTLARKFPVVLDTLAPGASVGLTTQVSTLLESYPDGQALASATHAQVRCTVFLDKGVVQGQTGWFPINDAEKSAQDRGK